MHSTSRNLKGHRTAGSFWAFIIGIALGGTLGAVLTHKVLSEQHGAAPVTQPPAGTDSTEDRIARQLREWRLSPEDIKRELGHAGVEGHLGLDSGRR
jgi:hypothetical protein